MLDSFDNDDAWSKQEPVRKLSTSASTQALLKLQPRRESQESESATIIQAIFRGKLTRKNSGVYLDEVGNRSTSPSTDLFTPGLSIDIDPDASGNEILTKQGKFGIICLDDR
jgi:hypothetical protein